jgi:hypothetical protein
MRHHLRSLYGELIGEYEPQLGQPRMQGIQATQSAAASNS